MKRRVWRENLDCHCFDSLNCISYSVRFSIYTYIFIVIVFCIVHIFISNPIVQFSICIWREIFDDFTNIFLLVKRLESFSSFLQSHYFSQIFHENSQPNDGSLDSRRKRRSFKHLSNAWILIKTIVQTDTTFKRQSASNNSKKTTSFVLTTHLKRKRGNIIANNSFRRQILLQSGLSIAKAVLVFHSFDPQSKILPVFVLEKLNRTKQFIESYFHIVKSLYTEDLWYFSKHRRIEHRCKVKKSIWRRSKQ